MSPMQKPIPHVRRIPLLSAALTACLFFVLFPPVAHAEIQSVFTPNTPIPGTAFASTVPADQTLFSKYIGTIYTYGLAVSSTIATVMFIWGAFIYLLGSANVGSVAKGKSIMIDSIIGLLLVFGANFILRTLNPDLVTMKVLNLTTIQTDTMDPTGTITERTSTGQIWTTPVLGHSKGNICLLQTFGKTDAEITGRTVSVTFLGDTYRFHALAAPDFQAAFSELENAPVNSSAGQWVNLMKRMAPYSGGCGIKSPYPDRGSRTGGAYVPRLDARIAKAAESGNIPCLSCDLHALGLAVDFDPCYNKMCKEAPCSMSDPAANRIPQEVVQIFARHHIYWGGFGWKDTGTNIDLLLTGRDPMHFEWHGGCW